ncbi:hypothetical protein M409DRAFT_66529 [Zasmidium cellare ATCC 36951]|uniref:Carboxypeptidase n=1 Tax=Zasmidium cellare ATCC 36951 TaxID=1080233 RepID=A0A6A6CL78_ZASCE|nr:uncharacterized protein M409DRAFT_66529 [Zasmidium cellare ATCC 36951]KAF2166479.1 hypothetical protein M409DRAFT_66529 [Zasmidium cellare ATCC 36951]
MRFLHSQAAAAISFASLVTSQFVSPPTNLSVSKGFLDIPVRWTEVPPGICELTQGVKSYSGYVDVSERDHPRVAPLTVFINGRPGSSSMESLFQENGPCSLPNDRADVVFNKYSWSNVSNMLYIDQPVQVGFSYNVAVPGYQAEGADSGDGDNYNGTVPLPGNSCPDYAPYGSCATFSSPNISETSNSTRAAAPLMWKTLQGFLGAFSRFQNSKFNFATESYGGHYGPIFMEYLVAQNDLIRSGDLPGAHFINLRTLLIGNGWYDPIVHREAYYNFTVSPGNTYDLSPFNETTQKMLYDALYAPGACLDLVRDCRRTQRDDVCAFSDNFCIQTVDNSLSNYGNRDIDDIRELMPDPFPYERYVLYLNTESVQRALGVFVNYTVTSGTSYLAFASTGDDSREAGTVEAVENLIKRGVYVVQYAGDADYDCSWIGGEVIAEQVGAGSVPLYQSAGYANLSTTDDVVHGQVKQAANFAFIRIYESGHLVPFYQPLAALEMFERAINGRDIETGRINITQSYSTNGTTRSEYREGNSTVQFKPVSLLATFNTTTNEPNPER